MGYKLINRFDWHDMHFMPEHSDSPILIRNFESVFIPYREYTKTYCESDIGDIVCLLEVNLKTKEIKKKIGDSLHLLGKDPFGICMGVGNVSDIALLEDEYLIVIGNKGIVLDKGGQYKGHFPQDYSVRIDEGLMKGEISDIAIIKKEIFSINITEPLLLKFNPGDSRHYLIRDLRKDYDESSCIDGMTVVRDNITILLNHGQKERKIMICDTKGEKLNEFLIKPFDHCRGIGSQDGLVYLIEKKYVDKCCFKDVIAGYNLDGKKEDEIIVDECRTDLHRISMNNGVMVLLTGPVMFQRCPKELIVYKKSE